MATSSQSYDRRRRISAALRRLMPSGGHTWTVPVITLLLLLGLVAGAVIMSTVTRRHVQLDDGTVWVTSLKNQKAARFNVKNKEADAGVSSSAPRFDIAQHNGDTILTETTKASTIKASTVSTGVKTDIKANTTTVVGGDTAALINEKTGNVWTGLSENLDSVTPTTSDPKIKLGEGGRIAVTHDGKVYGYRPSDGMVLRLDNPSSAKAKTLESLTDGKQQTVESFTVIGSTPVIATGKTVIFKGGRVDVDTTGTLTLQEPPTDDIQSDWVAAASPRGLALIPLKSNAKANFIANGGKANPARPVSSKGCVYSAWSQKASNYIRACSPRIPASSRKPSNPSILLPNWCSAPTIALWCSTTRLTAMCGTLRIPPKSSKYSGTKYRPSRPRKNSRTTTRPTTTTTSPRPVPHNPAKSKPRMMKSAHEPVRNRFSTRCAMTSRPIVPY